MGAEWAAMDAAGKAVFNAQAAQAKATIEAEHGVAPPAKRKAADDSTSADVLCTIRQSDILLRARCPPRGRRQEEGEEGEGPRRAAQGQDVQRLGALYVFACAAPFRTA